MLRALLFPAMAALLLAGCSASGDAAADGGRTVVATTTQAADLARAVGGARVSVVGLLAPNADPHDYEVRPDDVKALAGAMLVVRSGGDLDDWLGDAIEASGTHAPTLTLIDHVERRGDDPHWWQDPRNGIRAVAALRDGLVRADPDGRRGYVRRAAHVTARLRALDAAAARCLARIPASRRKLVTTHDALGYYAARYDLEVVGTVIPSLSTRAQPSAGDVAALVAMIRREGVGAVFAESSVRPEVERAIAREAGARVGRPLWADTLGPAESDGATYLRSLAANTRAIAEGLGALRCRLPA
ncbi:MAG TPA: zinc ABC transporter substrate-binding protein [Solirubrobacteraceae bacterium]|nr:zinc ABC transporter substrate-binding protein [Solirubrobacteraceae bacterium]